MLVADTFALTSAIAWKAAPVETMATNAHNTACEATGLSIHTDACFAIFLKWSEAVPSTATGTFTKILVAGTASISISHAHEADSAKQCYLVFRSSVHRLSIMHYHHQDSIMPCALKLQMLADKKIQHIIASIALIERMVTTKAVGAIGNLGRSSLISVPSQTNAVWSHALQLPQGILRICNPLLKTRCRPSQRRPLNSFKATKQYSPARNKVATSSARCSSAMISNSDSCSWYAANVS